METDIWLFVLVLLIVGEIDMIVVSDSWVNNKEYDGNTRKFGITYKGVDYIVKLPKGNNLSVICEYIASNFIQALGYNCHTVYLGRYDNQLVDVILDFTSGTNYKLHSFKDTKQSSEDTDISAKEYTYSDVLYLIDKHIKLNDTEKEKAKTQFWQMFMQESPNLKIRGASKKYKCSK